MIRYLSLLEKEKKTAWETWIAIGDVTLALRMMIRQLTLPGMDKIMSLIDKYEV